MSFIDIFVVAVPESEASFDVVNVVVSEFMSAVDNALVVIYVSVSDTDVVKMV